ERRLAVLERAAASFQADAVMRYAWLLAETGQVDQAVALFEAARLRYPPGDSIAAWEASALFKAGRRDRARELVHDFARRQPYGVAAAAVRGYVEGTSDYEPVPDLKDRLDAGRAGNLVLALAALELGRADEALAAARAAQELGQVSGADRPDDAAEAARLLAR